MCKLFCEACFDKSFTWFVLQNNFTVRNALTLKIFRHWDKLWRRKSSDAEVKSHIEILQWEWSHALKWLCTGLLRESYCLFIFILFSFFFLFFFYFTFGSDIHQTLAFNSISGWKMIEFSINPNISPLQCKTALYLS